MRISDRLAPKNVKVPLRGKKKREVIIELCEQIFADRAPEARQSVIDDVLAREKVASTGIGAGVAVPHGRTDLCSEIEVAVGLSLEGIHFDAIDEQPVQIVILLLCPMDKPNRQIRMLARVSRLFHDDDLRQSLLTAKSADELCAALRCYEDMHFG